MLISFELSINQSINHLFAYNTSSKIEAMKEFEHQDETSRAARHQARTVMAALIKHTKFIKQQL